MRLRVFLISQMPAVHPQVDYKHRGQSINHLTFAKLIGAKVHLCYFKAVHRGGGRLEGEEYLVGFEKSDPKKALRSYIKRGLNRGDYKDDLQLLIYFNFIPIYLYKTYMTIKSRSNRDKWNVGMISVTCSTVNGHVRGIVLTKMKSYLQHRHTWMKPKSSESPIVIPVQLKFHSSKSDAHPAIRFVSFAGFDRLKT